MFTVDGRPVDGMLFAGGATQTLVYYNHILDIEKKCEVPSIVPHLGIQVIGARSGGVFAAVAVAAGLDHAHMNLGEGTGQLFEPNIGNIFTHWSLGEGDRLKAYVKSFLELNHMDGMTVGDIESKHNTKLLIHAKNVSTGQDVMFPPDTPLELAMTATCSISVIFPPVEYKGHLYVDCCFLGGREGVRQAMLELCSHNMITMGYKNSREMTPTSVHQYFWKLLKIALVDGSPHHPREIMVQHEMLDLGSSLQFETKLAQVMLRKLHLSFNILDRVDFQRKKTAPMGDVDEDPECDCSRT